MYHYCQLPAGKPRRSTVIPKASAACPAFSTSSANTNIAENSSLPNDKNVVSSPTKPKQKPSLESAPGDGKEGETIGSLGKSSPSERDLRRFSCDVPRSPTIPAEIRRSNSVNSPKNFQTPPAIVARLMGLDEIQASPSPVSTAEKRRKLLGALEKCDADLKALKKIIESVRSGEPLVVEGAGVKGRASSVTEKCFPGVTDDGVLRMKERRCLEVNGEQPSPVSVLEEICSSPLSWEFKRQRKGEQNKKLREDSTDLSFFPRLSGRREDYLCRYIGSPPKKTNPGSPFWSRKAMIESVNEACQHVARGETRELRRIVLVLQEDIFGELIEETIRELKCYYMYSLPLEACRRRLRF
ncbi:hypothetical protein HHK36_017065 [Tetracentron sinense]|uniref:DUF3741 domain-containing protein n=1 Tax=Tetracentron sinense TaxID=13715 RepID=A0A834YY82_TETSI|nr:hypothetical protein HHK36_017065 [Tetracentron sinense]